MSSSTITLNTGARYNLLGMIKGEVTSGVTITGTRPGQTANVSRLVLQGSPANGANNVAYGDNDIATNGTSGVLLATGVTHIFDGHPSPTLNLYIAVTANGTILNVYWE